MSNMLTKSHVQLREHPITWKVTETSGSSAEGKSVRIQHQVYFDTLHQELIRLSRNPTGPAYVSISNHDTSKWVECDCGIPDPQVMRMKFSANRTFLALQVSNREVKVVDVLRGRLVAARSCRSNKSRITNIYWCQGKPQDNQLFLFVTNTGAELYMLKMQTMGSTLKHLKTVQHQTRYHWFVNSSNWLLVVDLKHVFSLYHVEPKGLVRHCKFELNCRGTNYNSNSEAYYEQITLVEMYGEVMCVYINELKGKLYILGLNRDTMVQKYVYDIYSSSKYKVSVVDNVLIVHNMIAKMAILFDIYTDPKSSLAAPLPIASDQYEKKKKNEAKNRNRTRALTVQEQKYDSWRFLAQRYVLDNSNVKTSSSNSLWTMQLDLEAIMHSWPSQKRGLLVEFLLKRQEGNCKSLLLKVMFEMVLSGESLKTLSVLYTRINSIFQEASKKSSQSNSSVDLDLKESGGDGMTKGSKGFQVLTQEQICEDVFERCLKKGMSGKRLTPYVLEFINSICRLTLPLSPKVNMFLVDLLLLDGRYFELHQFLQYHVLQDSMELASKLISHEKKYEPAYQLGLDMMYRLTGFTQMMKVMLDHGQALEALQLVPHTSAIFLEKGLRPKDFLHVAKKSERSTTFFTCYRFFQARNQALRGSPIFEADDGCDEFVKLFYENFRNREETSALLVQSDKTSSVVSGPAAPPPSSADTFIDAEDHLISFKHTSNDRKLSRGSIDTPERRSTVDSLDVKDKGKVTQPVPAIEEVPEKVERRDTEENLPKNIEQEDRSVNSNMENKEQEPNEVKAETMKTQLEMPVNETKHEISSTDVEAPIESEKSEALSEENDKASVKIDLKMDFESKIKEDSQSNADTSTVLSSSNVEDGSPGK